MKYQGKATSPNRRVERAMSKFKLAIVAASVVFGIGTVQDAGAAVTYQYVTDKPTYSAAQSGTSVTVQLFLQETLTGTSTSLLAPARENGVAGLGLKVTRGSGNSILATLNENSTDFSGPEQHSVAAGLIAFTIAPGPPPQTNPQIGNTAGGTVTNPAANGRIYMGSITVTAGSTPTTFTVGPFDGSGGNSLSGKNFYDLDFSQSSPAADAYTGASSNPGTFTVTVAPEPASFGIIGAAISIGLLRRRRVLPA